MGPSRRHSSRRIRTRCEFGHLTEPWFWIVGGPNGSGKSTLIRHGTLDVWTSGLRALSPDDIVLELRPRHSDWTELALLRAAQALSDGQVDRAIKDGTSVMVETVLSSDKFQQPVEAAIGAGFRFGFVYVTVTSADLNAARVRNRVARGGHDVPLELIRARRERSHAAAFWFAQRANVGLVFDNSGAAPALLAEKRDGDAAWRIFDPERITALGLHLPA